MSIPDSRIPVVLICVAYGHNKPRYNLYEESKMPPAMLNRVRTVKTDEYSKICYDNPDDDTHRNTVDDALEAAELHVNVSNGIPDNYKVVTIAAYHYG